MEPKATQTLEATAYEAYGRTTDFKNFQGNPMPAFGDLPPKIREAWKNAAQAVAVAVREGR